LFASVWACLFALAFWGTASRQEEEVLRLHRLLVSAQNREAYALEERLRVDGREEVSLSAVAQAAPRLARVTSRVRLTDSEDIRFAVYFSPDALYIYSGNSGVWNRAAYNHPAAAELEELRDPFAFWLRMLAHASEVRARGGGRFEVTLRPFRDDIHGMHVEDVLEANMLISLDEGSGRLDTLTLRARLKPSIIKNRQEIEYTARVVGDAGVPALTLPEAAQSAMPLP
jgi:hypothetical protein